MTRILHLSDLHLTTKFPTQFSGTKVRFCSLVDKIVEKNLIPDIIVISGDIVHQGDALAFKEFENLIDYALNRFKRCNYYSWKSRFRLWENCIFKKY